MIKGNSLKAFLTIEISIIMGIVFLVICLMIRYSMLYSYEVVRTFQLHRLVERFGHQEVINFNNEKYGIRVHQEQNTIVGSIDGGNFVLEIERNYFQPEEWIRMLTLLEQ